MRNGRCTGCSTKLRLICVIKYERYLREICPCSICLVKSMCMEFCLKRIQTYSTLLDVEKDNLFRIEKLESRHE